MKVCTKCSESKPLSEFSPSYKFRLKDGSTRHYRSTACKPCKALAKRLRQRNLSRKDWDKLSAVWACQICGKDGDVELCVDHDHKTGKVRGLLCRYCNLGIGNLQDSPKLLRSAISYLTEHKETNK